jgi:hypothetical protein
MNKRKTSKPITNPSQTCASWLACESLDAVHQKYRVSFFAGKPAPTVNLRWTGNPSAQNGDDR